MMSNTHSSSIITTPVEELQDGAESISLEQLQFLVRLVDQSDIVELEVTHSSTRRTLVLRKSGVLISDAASAESCSPTREATNYEAEPRRYTITAPYVGFFQPWSKSKNNPLVVVGDTVKDGQQVAVIRSLGISNEVESPVTGRIVEILVQDGQPIEYGQPLMAIEN
jgi:acetyl-CoA carboxylase biotin carboxyl carrier protein